MLLIVEDVTLLALYIKHGIWVNWNENEAAASSAGEAVWKLLSEWGGILIIGGGRREAVKLLIVRMS